MRQRHWFMFLCLWSRHIWKTEAPGLLSADMKDVFLSVPSIQVLLSVCTNAAQTDDSAHFRASVVTCLTAAAGFCRALLPAGPIVFCSVVLSSCSLLVRCLCKVFEGLSAIFVLARGTSVINPQRCSHGDQFVVILLVMLLLSVVFNNSTIYGQKYELEWVVVFAAAWEQAAVL